VSTARAVGTAARSRSERLLADWHSLHVERNIIAGAPIFEIEEKIREKISSMKDTMVIHVFGVITTNELNLHQTLQDHTAIPDMFVWMARAKIVRKSYLPDI
jgi:hypothetical protein